MAGTVVHYARFVEVQQRRARVVAQLMQPVQEMPAETSGVVPPEDQPGVSDEPRRQFRSALPDVLQQPTRDAKRDP